MDAVLPSVVVFSDDEFYPMRLDEGVGTVNNMQGGMKTKRKVTFRHLIADICFRPTKQRENRYARSACAAKQHDFRVTIFREERKQADICFRVGFNTYRIFHLLHSIVWQENQRNLIVT